MPHFRVAPGTASDWLLIRTTGSSGRDNQPPSLRHERQSVAPCSRKLAFCDHTSTGLSPHGAVLCGSNGMIIALFDASAHSLDDCSLYKAFKHDDRQC